MAGSRPERNSHIPRSGVPAVSATSIQTRNRGTQSFNPSASHISSFRNCFPALSQRLQPEPARLVLASVHELGVSPMTSGDMGNVVMQSAGDTTDQYVVLIGNIPWKEKWQDLKDLVREWTPNIERAEIYTSEGRSRGFGYVRIKGLDAAKMVQEHLDGYVWDGRALVAKLGNLQYDCPIGGVTTKLGPGQIIPPHYPQVAQSSVQGAPSSSTEWQNPAPTSASGFNLWHSDPWYQHIYPALVYHTDQATAYYNKSKQLWAEVTEATRFGRLAEVRELQKQFNAYREAGRQASEHAMYLGRSVQVQVGVPVVGLNALSSGGFYPQSYSTTSIPPHGSGTYQGQQMWSASSNIHPAGLAPGIESTGLSVSPASTSQPPESFMVPINVDMVHVAPTPYYITPPNGLPVNLSYGAVQTECRSVFIGNLPYETTWKELKDFLEGSTRVEVPRNVDNRAKGHAIATFDSSEAASEACLRFNNASFKGRQLRVRMDRHYETKRLGVDLTTTRTAGTEGAIDKARLTSSQAERRTGSGSRTEATRYAPPVVVDGSKVRS